VFSIISQRGVIREGALKGLGGPSGCGGVRGNLHFWSIFPPSARSTVTHPRSLIPLSSFSTPPSPSPCPPPSPLPPSLCCSLFPVRTKQRFHVLSSKLAYLLPDSTVARGTDWRHRVPKRLGAFVGSPNPRIPVLGSRSSRLIPIRCCPSSRLALVRAERERARLAIHLRGGALFAIVRAPEDTS